MRISILSCNIYLKCHKYFDHSSGIIKSNDNNDFFGILISILWQMVIPEEVWSGII